MHHTQSYIFESGGQRKLKSMYLLKYCTWRLAHVLKFWGFKLELLLKEWHSLMLVSYCRLFLHWKLFRNETGCWKNWHWWTLLLCSQSISISFCQSGTIGDELRHHSNHLLAHHLKVTKWYYTIFFPFPLWCAGSWENKTTIKKGEMLDRRPIDAF